MTLFDVIKRYYENGIYTKENLKSLVKKGKITPDRYREITGEDYVE